MRVLIIDDNSLWIEQGKRLLEGAAHEVQSYLVSAPLFDPELRPDMNLLLDWVEAVICDKDLGHGHTSTRVLCVIRSFYPKLPVIRWTGGDTWEQKDVMERLGIATMSKPTLKSREWFVKQFLEKVEESQNLLSKELENPLAIMADLTEVVNPQAHRENNRAKRLRQIAEISQLAYASHIPATDNLCYRHWTYMEEGPDAVTVHELGHCICDGELNAEDIAPHMQNLQFLITLLEKLGKIDQRFRITAEFIKAGKLDELELVKGCY